MAVIPLDIPRSTTAPNHDLVGAVLCLAGVAVIMYAPRASGADPHRPGRSRMTEANKTVVRQLLDEVLNGGHLEVIDELSFLRGSP
jgi:hypothetical protein